MKFLISRLSALGDVVCTLPAAVALKRSFPDSHVTWVVDKRFVGIVECCKAVDEVVVAKPGFKPSSWPKLADEFDAAFDMQGLLKSAIVLKGLKCPRYGYHWQREGANLFSQAVLPDPTSFHIVDQYVDVVRAFEGVTMQEAEFDLIAKAEDLASIREKLGSIGSFAVINPGAGWVSKRWPAESFAQTIDYLTSRGVTSVLIGGKAQADIDSANEVVSKCAAKPVDLVGKTSVRELVALLEMSSLHVGGDTGSTHLAAALKKPSIGLYSITNPKRSCPYGQISNCLYEPSSLSNISPESVKVKLDPVLARL